MEKHYYGWDPKRVARKEPLIEEHNSNNRNYKAFEAEFGRAVAPRPPLPTRKTIDHRGPLSIDVAGAIYFITIAAAERGTSVLTDNAETILDAARFYQTHGKWFLYLFLIMPDHIHMLVHVPCESGGEGLAALPGNSGTMVGRSVPDRREPETELERVIGIGNISSLMRHCLPAGFLRHADSR